MVRLSREPEIESPDSPLGPADWRNSFNALNQPPGSKPFPGLLPPLPSSSTSRLLRTPNTSLHPSALLLVHSYHAHDNDSNVHDAAASWTTCLFRAHFRSWRWVWGCCSSWGCACASIFKLGG